VDGASLYARNAVAMWSSLVPWSRPVPGTPPGVAVIGVPSQRASRILLRWPGAAEPGQIAALVTAATEHGRVVVEDSFGDLRLPLAGQVTVERMPLMLRPAGGVAAPVNGTDIDVVRVADRDALAIAEQVIVDGFPRRVPRPYPPGIILPPQMLTAPGWAMWLACHDGDPAAAVCSYDDGAALGIYWLATLPRHRSRGLGRAVMTAALGGCPGLPAVLVATAAAESLYLSLGFTAVAEAVWCRIPDTAA
jgi:GNAT superfamily N-acetyltransferase